MQKKREQRRKRMSDSLLQFIFEKNSSRPLSVVSASYLSSFIVSFE
jgi:hypothetical protein